MGQTERGRHDRGQGRGLQNILKRWNCKHGKRDLTHEQHRAGQIQMRSLLTQIAISAQRML